MEEYDQTLAFLLLLVSSVLGKGMGGDERLEEKPLILFHDEIFKCVFVPVDVFNVVDKVFAPVFASHGVAIDVGTTEQWIPDWRRMNLIIGRARHDAHGFIELILVEGFSVKYNLA